jgi:serine/threonine protein kinase
MREFVLTIVVNLIVWSIVALIGWSVVRARRRLRELTEHASSAADVRGSGGELEAELSDPDIDVPPALSLLERIGYLERERDSAAAEAIAARRRGADDGAFEDRRSRLNAYLGSMAFLRHDDLIDDRYRLLNDCGGGRLAVVWRAYDQEKDRIVAVKILRYSCVSDASIVEQFRYTARVMSRFTASNIPAVYQEVRQLPEAGPTKLAYYVLQHVDGLTLEQHLALNRNDRDQLLDRLFGMGQGVAGLHAHGVVHRDIKPSNILVEPNGGLTLVDFDAVLRLGDRQVTHQGMGTFGYSAPEVLNGSDPDVSADVFAMGRVFSYLFYGQHLPSAYEKSVYEVVNLLNCGPHVKETLERAVSVPVDKRFPSMRTFLDKMRVAIDEEREKRLPFIETTRWERERIQRTLLHSFYGTLILMLIARPLFAMFESVEHPLLAQRLPLPQLSDTVQVAIFHGIIGSLAWGVFISGAYLIYLIVFHRMIRNRTTGYAVASLCCALGGLLAGALLSLPSVFVTNEFTLQCLGWLTSGATDRLGTALQETRMMMAFPLTGLFTGLGTGLCLHKGIEAALEREPQGTGILPVPTKRDKHDAVSGFRIGPYLLQTRSAHLFLLFPAIFAPLVMLALDPSPVAANSLVATSQLCRVAPNEMLRTLGEGMIHYAGAVGLIAGFFYSVRTEKPTKW